MLVPEEIRDAILERAEGNPLFAEEYVRLLDDRGLLDASDGTVRLRSGATLPVPDSIGALLAARLDTLPRARKAVLADASVVGHVFWAGTVASMGERDAGESVLTDARRARAAGVRPPRWSPPRWSARPRPRSGTSSAGTSRTPSSRGPRGPRGMWLRPAWMEAKAGDRVEDIAEVARPPLHDGPWLAEATGDAALAASIRPAAARLLRLSGKRALGLDTTTAVAAYEHALRLMDGGRHERAGAVRRAWHRAVPRRPV